MLKITSFVLASILVVGAAATASSPYDRGYRDHRGGWHRHGPDIGVGVVCAPEVLQGNVAATDRSLATLAASADFAGATEFKSQVHRIAALSAPDVRATEYFKLIGVDASNKASVVEFIGSRDVSSATLVELQRNTGLSDVQANKVVATLQTALRGDLQ